MIFDQQELIKYTENDTELSRQLMQMAFEDIPDFLESAIQSGQSGFVLEAAEYLHKIKGIAGTIGAVKIHTISSELELSLKKSGSADELDRRKEELGLVVDSFFSHHDVRQYLN